MKRLFTLLIIFYAHNVFAQDEILLLEKLTLEDSFSEELKIITSHLAKNPIERDRAEEAIAAMKIVNSDILKMDSVNLLYLVKSEIYKGLLNNQYLAYNNSIQVSSVILKSIREKMKKYDLNYSDMAKWIFESIEKDLAPYEKDSFIDTYQTVGGGNVKLRAKAMELTKALKYIAPWVIAYESKTPEEFNHLLTNICVDILIQLSRKTYFFSEFTSKFSSNQRDPIFKLPTLPQKDEVILGPAPDASLKAQSKKNKEKAKDTIETLENTQDLEGSSQAIDKLIQDKNDNPDEWKPKD